MCTQEDIAAVLERVRARDPNEKEFLQAVTEVSETLQPVLKGNADYLRAFERLCEPERMIMFRVPWSDDNGIEHVNRGYRVQFSSTLGPYKGGLRFHPTVSLSVIKFLGFEQVLKNSLTTLMLGGGKGGSDFDPKGKSDAEVMRFCQSFMTELHRHIGADTDVPAGDIGVGGREIGYLFGAYKRYANVFSGVLTGKNLNWGGSPIRPEATGYGVAYFATEALARLKDTSLVGKKCLVSGSGNVAQYLVDKLLSLGAVVLTMSDSSGFVHAPAGFTRAMLEEMFVIKNKLRGRVSDLCSMYPEVTFTASQRPWTVQCDYAFPCATQNEINDVDANALVKSGCQGVFEGANMPSTNEAIRVFQTHGLIFGPAKAVNAGGVAVSGLEMAQNSQHLAWAREQVDTKLSDIMKSIVGQCLSAAETAGQANNLQLGANIAGFLKVADSMLEQGLV